MVFNGIQNIVNKNKKSIWRGERECRKEGDAIYLFNGYTRERKGGSAYISRGKR